MRYVYDPCYLSQEMLDCFFSSVAKPRKAVETSNINESLSFPLRQIFHSIHMYSHRQLAYTDPHLKNYELT